MGALRGWFVRSRFLVNRHFGDRRVLQSRPDSAQGACDCPVRRYLDRRAKRDSTAILSAMVRLAAALTSLILLAAVSQAPCGVLCSGGQCSTHHRAQQTQPASSTGCQHETPSEPASSSSCHHADWNTSQWLKPLRIGEALGTGPVAVGARGSAFSNSHSQLVVRSPASGRPILLSPQRSVEVLRI